jgi:antirestriction protein ArdC
MAKRKSYAPKVDIAQEITDAVIAQMESSNDPWENPSNATGGMPRNAIKGNMYHGVNPFILWHTAQTRGYSANLWATFKQWKGVGAKVKKGQNKANGCGGTRIVFFKFFRKVDEKTGLTKSFPLTKFYTVFNIDQCEDVPEKYQAGAIFPELSDEERIAGAEEFFSQLEKGSTVTVKEGGTSACYVPSLDEVRVPNFRDYKSPEGYYSTKAHEHGHSTGHKSRLDRIEAFGNRFGSSAYAYEELVAEMTAAFACAHLGIKRNLQHPEYLSHWIKVLKGDKKALFTAASQARKAMIWLLETAGEDTSAWAYQSGPDAQKED